MSLDVCSRRPRGVWERQATAVVAPDPSRECGGRHSGLALLFGAVLLLAQPAPANAAPEVAPGETLVFSAPDGGSRECRIQSFSFSPGDCDFPRWSVPPTLIPPAPRMSTDFDVGARTVQAFFQPILPLDLSEDNHASATIFNEFTVAGSEGEVAAEISVTFDFDGFLAGSFAYVVEAGLSLVLSDVTAGAPGVVIDSLPLLEKDRSGDQGFTDVALGGAAFVELGEGGGIKALLRRGNTYRIGFQAFARGASLLVGTPGAKAVATWSDLRVTLDEDEVQLLGEHDEAIQSQIADHDRDINERLDVIDARQKEIIRLLNTPQGQRSSDFEACDGEPCDFPEVIRNRMRSLRGLR
jgi:hypothetical protein